MTTIKEAIDKVVLGVAELRTEFNEFRSDVAEFRAAIEDWKLVREQQRQLMSEILQRLQNMIHNPTESNLIEEDSTPQELQPVSSSMNHNLNSKVDSVSSSVVADVESDEIGFQFEMSNCPLLKHSHSVISPIELCMCENVKLVMEPSFSALIDDLNFCILPVRQNAQEIISLVSAGKPPPLPPEFMWTLLSRLRLHNQLGRAILEIRKAEARLLCWISVGLPCCLVEAVLDRARLPCCLVDGGYVETGPYANTGTLMATQGTYPKRQKLILALKQKPHLRCYHVDLVEQAGNLDPFIGRDKKFYKLEIPFEHVLDAVSTVTSNLLVEVVVCYWNAMISALAVRTACAHVKFVPFGLKVFDSMTYGLGIDPTMELYGCIIELFGRAGLLTKVREVTETMPFKPGATVLEVNSRKLAAIACKQFGQETILLAEYDGKEMQHIETFHMNGIWESEEQEAIRYFQLLKKPDVKHYDLDETLIVANTMKSFEDKIDMLRSWINQEIDPVKIASMTAEMKQYVDDRVLLKQYAENDYVTENGKVLNTKPEEVAPLSDNHERVFRPAIRLPDRNIVLTRINPEVRDTSVLVRLRPSWFNLREYLVAKGRKRFEVYVCTMAEKDHAHEMWRLLDPEASLNCRNQLLHHVVCVRSGFRKSLLNVIKDGICHPKMAMVIDVRLKVWEDTDQPRVHVVPPFIPYCASQAETDNAVPVLCFAINVASNVRGGFFKEFDKTLLRRISDLLYEDDAINLPLAPDVSNFLMPEDAGFVPNGGAPIAEGMRGPKVECTLNQTNEKMYANSLNHASQNNSMVRSGLLQAPAEAVPGVSQAGSRTIPASQNSSLLGTPGRRDGGVPESDFEARRRLGAKPSQDVTNGRALLGLPPEPVAVKTFLGPDRRTQGEVDFDDVPLNIFELSNGIAKSKVCYGKLYEAFSKNLILGMSCTFGRSINGFFIFSLPRPPEVIDLEDKVAFKGGGMLHALIWITSGSLV